MVGGDATAAAPPALQTALWTRNVMNFICGQQTCLKLFIHIAGPVSFCGTTVRNETRPKINHKLNSKQLCSLSSGFQERAATGDWKMALRAASRQGFVAQLLFSTRY